MFVYLCAKSEKSSAHNRLRTCKGSFLFFFDILMLVQQYMMMTMMRMQWMMTAEDGNRDFFSDGIQSVL